MQLLLLSFKVLSNEIEKNEDFPERAKMKIYDEEATTTTRKLIIFFFFK